MADYAVPFTDGPTGALLEVIGSAQSAGFALTEIRSIIDARAAGDVPCGHATALLQANLDA